MTDKEWKDLCKWAKSLDRKELTLTPLFIGNCIELYIEETKIFLTFYASGMFCADGKTIVKNLKAEQIKAIITNLL